MNKFKGKSLLRFFLRGNFSKDFFFGENRKQRRKNGNILFRDILFRLLEHFFCRFHRNNVIKNRRNVDIGFPRIIVTFAPRKKASVARESPIFPELLFVSTRTGSMASSVLPRVMRTFSPQVMVLSRNDEQTGQSLQQEGVVLLQQHHTQAYLIR